MIRLSGASLSTLAILFERLHSDAYVALVFCRALRCLQQPVGKTERFASFGRWLVSCGAMLLLRSVWSLLQMTASHGMRAFFACSAAFVLGSFAPSAFTLPFTAALSGVHRLHARLKATQRVHCSQAVGFAHRFPTCSQLRKLGSASDLRGSNCK